jgi:hypothetical protein
MAFHPGLPAPSTINQPPSTSTQYIYLPENGNNYFQLFLRLVLVPHGGMRRLKTADFPVGRAVQPPVQPRRPNVKAGSALWPVRLGPPAKLPPERAQQCSGVPLIVPRRNNFNPVCRNWQRIPYPGP